MTTKKYRYILSTHDIIISGGMYMENSLKLILDKLNIIDSDLKELKQGQKGLEQGQINLTDKLDAFEKQTMKRFNEVDSKIDSVSNAVADLMEFRTDTESRLKKIK